MPDGDLPHVCFAPVHGDGICKAKQEIEECFRVSPIAFPLITGQQWKRKPLLLLVLSAC